ncbi:hypothetical protein KR222_002286 [Zaprionus bogoriensis]|nr:hypothetical protein KR222_002286 [Zaprionus bogoriensis]
MEATLDANYFAVQRRALEMLGFKLQLEQRQQEEQQQQQQQRQQYLHPLRLAHPVWAALLLLSVVSHNWPMLVDALLRAHDLIRFTENLAIINQGSLSTFKLLVFILKRRRIGALLQRLHRLNASSCGLEQLHLIRQQNQWDVRLCSIYRNAVYITVCTSAVAPLASALWVLASSGLWAPRPPMEFSFWLDETQPRYYWPIYLWGIFGISAVAWVVIAVDTLFFWLVRNIVLRFQLLRLQLQRGNCGRRQLLQCVRLHCLALELAAQLSGIYAEIGFVQYTLSYLQLCTLTYRFSRGGWSPQLPFRAAFLLVVLVQLSAYCFGGEHIKQQSLRIGAEIYERFAWEQAPPRSRRMLQLMMLRAQRPAQVSGFMFNIDRPLLLWVVRTTGSFLAMLRTLER